MREQALVQDDAASQAFSTTSATPAYFSHKEKQEDKEEDGRAQAPDDPLMEQALQDILGRPMSSRGLSPTRPLRSTSPITRTLQPHNRACSPGGRDCLFPFGDDRHPHPSVVKEPVRAKGDCNNLQQRHVRDCGLYGDLANHTLQAYTSGKAGGND